MATKGSKKKKTNVNKQARDKFISSLPQNPSPSETVHAKLVRALGPEESEKALLDEAAFLVHKAEAMVNDLDESLNDLEDLVSSAEDESLANEFDVAGNEAGSKKTEKAGSLLKEMFSACPTCNDEKVRKSRAIEASKRVDMLGNIALIVKNFKASTDARFASLSSSLQDQLKPIVEASTQVALAKDALASSLDELEEHLKFAFGIKDEIPSDVTDAAMFPTEDTVMDIVFNDVPVSQPSEFDTTVDGMLDGLEDETVSSPRPRGRVVN
jgi:hypothetical protein